MNYYWKMYNRQLRLQTMLLPGPDLHSEGPWHFGIFAPFFRQIQVKTKKNSNLIAGPLALHHMLNPSLVIALRS